MLASLALKKTLCEQSQQASLGLSSIRLGEEALRPALTFRGGGTFKDKEQCGAYEKDDIRGKGVKAKEFWGPSLGWRRAGVIRSRATRSQIKRDCVLFGLGGS